MWQFIEKLVEIITPEEARLRKLLSLGPSLITRVLPRSSLRQPQISALFDYQNKIVRLLVRAVKFKNNPKARRVAASLLYDEFLQMAADSALFEGSLPILVPMPMSKKECRARGYNQCEELVREMQKIAADQMSVAFDLLRKICDTARQMHLSREARIKNVHGAMQVFDPQETLKNKNVIVLDDIHTTGSTFAEARRALLASGARSVSGLFLAH